MTRSEEAEASMPQSKAGAVATSISETEQVKTLNRDTALACPDYSTYIASAVNSQDLFYIEVSHRRS